MKILCAFAFIIFFVCTAYSQQSFEVVISHFGHESVYYTIEDNHNYILLGGHDKIAGTEGKQPMIVVISDSGEIVEDTSFFKNDTSYYLKFGFVKPNGNYWAIGCLSDSVTPYEYNCTYVCEMTPDFQLVWEKIYTLPFLSSFTTHRIKNFLRTPDSCIIIEGIIDTVQYSNQEEIFVSKLDLEGNQIIFNYNQNYEDYSIGGGSDLILNPDSTGLYLIGDLVRNLITIQWIEFDFNLNVISYGNIENLLSVFYSPASVKRLGNGNLIIANKSYGLNNSSYQDLEMRVVDQDFNLVRDTIIYHDEYVNIPDQRGLDFIDDNNVWVATYEREFIGTQGTSVFRIFIFDSELNLRGMNQFGGDTRYWLHDLLATSDGGCLITGEVPENSGDDDADLFVIKVMPEDILTSVDDTMEGKNENVIKIFPNPFSEHLQFECSSLKTEIRLYDQTGRIVCKSEINNTTNATINTGNLPAGLYYYQAFNDSDFIQNGKLLKLKN